MNVEVYSIQHYVIVFVRDRQQASALFSPGTPGFSTIKTEDIAEILLKVVLNA